MLEQSSEGFSIRQADWQDAILIQRLINSHSLVHRYLDWRDPLQWLGPQPFLLLEKNRAPLAVLACPADPANIAWVRLFACSWDISPARAWDLLMARAIQLLSATESNPRCFILALEVWIDLLLKQKKYQEHQQLVILQREISTYTPMHAVPDVKIRAFTEQDLPDVESIDADSFEDLWVYSLPTLQLAYQQSELSYLAEIGGKPVGYLLGTISDNTAHLARIAVLSTYTRHQIASRLIDIFFTDLKAKNINQVTVNTQSDNQASLALYDKMSFQRTGEAFTIYEVHKNKETCQ
jgi:ribosomal protein S18 acetylase RimI-like enzyme